MQEFSGLFVCLWGFITFFTAWETEKIAVLWFAREIRGISTQRDISLHLRTFSESLYNIFQPGGQFCITYTFVYRKNMQRTKNLLSHRCCPGNPYNMRCFTQFGSICTILKNVKNSQVGVLLLWSCRLKPGKIKARRKCLCFLYPLCVIVHVFYKQLHFCWGCLAIIRFQD